MLSCNEFQIQQITLSYGARHKLDVWSISIILHRISKLNTEQKLTRRRTRLLSNSKSKVDQYFVATINQPARAPSFESSTLSGKVLVLFHYLRGFDQHKECQQGLNALQVKKKRLQIKKAPFLNQHFPPCFHNGYRSKVQVRFQHINSNSN